MKHNLKTKPKFKLEGYSTSAKYTMKRCMVYSEAHHCYKELNPQCLLEALLEHDKAMIEELQQLKQTWTKKIVKGEHYDLALYFLKEVLGETKLE